MNRQSFRTAWHQWRSALRCCYGSPRTPTSSDMHRLDCTRSALPFSCRENRERQHMVVTTYPTTAPVHARRGHPRTVFEQFAQERIDLVRLLAIQRNDHFTAEGKYVSPRIVTRDINRLLRRKDA